MQQAKIRIQKKILFLMMLSSFVVFSFMLYTVLSGGSIVVLDSWISEHVPNMQSPALTTWVIFITNINGVVGSVIISTAVIALLLYKKYYKDAQFYLLAFLGSSALFTFIKLLVERSRPVLKIVNEQGLSFPSGHSSMSMTIALSLTLIMLTKVSSPLRRDLLMLFCIVWPLLIVSTRLYLNVHWVSDTIAGLSLGIFWTAFSYFLIYKKEAV